MPPPRWWWMNIGAGAATTTWMRSRRREPRGLAVPVHRAADRVRDNRSDRPSGDALKLIFRERALQAVE